jgi:hypothetical protein
MKKDQPERHEKPEASRPEGDLTEDSGILTAENQVESEPPWWRNGSPGPREVQ